MRKLEADQNIMFMDGAYISPFITSMAADAQEFMKAVCDTEDALSEAEESNENEDEDYKSHHTDTDDGGRNTLLFGKASMTGCPTHPSR